MSQKQVVTDREWLVAVTISVMLLPVGFFLFWHFLFNNWFTALVCTCAVADRAKAEWDCRFQRHAAPDRNIRVRGRSRRR